MADEATTFQCGVCGGIVSVEEGGTDDHPEACLSCWITLRICATEAERIQNLELKDDSVPGRSAPLTDEYRQGWADAAAIIVGRIRLLGTVDGMKAHVEQYKCIHCDETSPARDWREDGLVCPRCGGADDAPDPKGAA